LGSWGNNLLGCGAGFETSVEWFLADRNVCPAAWDLRDLLEAEADFVGRFGADGAGDFGAIIEEDGCGPELYSEGAAEGPAGAVLDFDVLDGWELGECFGDVQSGGLAEAAPGGTEFEEDWAGRGVDFFAGWARVLIFS
jgi:hypothetical protein